MDEERAESLKRDAQRLRAEGLSRRQIMDALGIRGHGVLNDLLKGTTPPEWTHRPRARDASRQRARELRLQGMTYREICTQLGVSMGSCSLWLRDLPRPPGQAERRNDTLREVGRAYWRHENARRAELRQKAVAAAADAVGSVSGRDLFVAGVVAYWAEGSKSKPYARRERVVFINSDPKMILLFRRWLELVGIPEERLNYRLSIHESGDVARATEFWAEVLSVESGRFLRASLKRHNPRTVRLNTDPATYNGCLVITVLNSASLYQHIDGWFSGLVSGVTLREQ